MNPILTTAVDYTAFTEAGAVGIALVVVLGVLIMGRMVLRMMQNHIDHLNRETEKHTALLQSISDAGDVERQETVRHTELLERLANVSERQTTISERHTDLLRDIAAGLNNGKPTRCEK